MAIASEAHTREQEEILRRRAAKFGYRLLKRKGSWSLVAAGDGRDSSLGKMTLDQVAEALYSMG